MYTGDIKHTYFLYVKCMKKILVNVCGSKPLHASANEAFWFVCKIGHVLRRLPVLKYRVPEMLSFHFIMS